MSTIHVATEGIMSSIKDLSGEVITARRRRLHPSTSMCAQYSPNRRGPPKGNSQSDAAELRVTAEKSNRVEWHPFTPVVSSSCFTREAALEGVEGAS